MNFAIEIEEGKAFPSFAILYPDNTLKFRGMYYKVTNVSILTQENSKAFLGTLGGAAAGSILGPIGLLAGLLSGGNRNKTTLMIECHEGPRLVGTVKAKEASAILGIVEKYKTIPDYAVEKPINFDRSDLVRKTKNLLIDICLGILAITFIVVGLGYVVEKSWVLAMLFFLMAALVFFASQNLALFSRKQRN